MYHKVRIVYLQTYALIGTDLYYFANNCYFRKQKIQAPSNFM